MIYHCIVPLREDLLDSYIFVSENEEFTEEVLDFLNDLDREEYYDILTSMSLDDVPDEDDIFKIVIVNENFIKQRIPGITEDYENFIFIEGLINYENNNMEENIKEKLSEEHNLNFDNVKLNRIRNHFHLNII